MDLSVFLVVGFGIFFPVAGTAWLEARSQKDRSPVRQDVSRRV
jgi:hypothetical protein